MMVALTLISGIDSAILSSFRNRQREIRKLYHTTGLHDCNAKSKSENLNIILHFYDNEEYFNYPSKIFLLQH